MKSFFTLSYYFCLLFGCKYSGKMFHNNFLSLKILNGLKGFSALSILIGHIVRNNPKYNKTILKYIPPGNFSIYPAFFLFCSGYGIMVSYKKRKNYLDDFLKKRLLKILIPFYLSKIAILSFSKYDSYDYQKSFLKNLQFLDILGNLFLYNYNWFVMEIITLYLLFYFSFKYIKNKILSKLLILIICWILFFIPTFFESNENNKYIFVRRHYHLSIYSFIYGLFIGDYEDMIIQIIKKFYHIFFSLSILFPYCFYIFNKYIYLFPYIRGNYFYYFFNYSKINIENIIIYSSFLIISMKFQFNNILLDYLGKYSYETYLFQFLIFKISDKYIIIDIIFWEVCFIIILTFYFSEISNFISQKLFDYITMNKKYSIKY